MYWPKSIWLVSLTLVALKHTHCVCQWQQAELSARDVVLILFFETILLSYDARALLAFLLRRPSRRLSVFAERGSRGVPVQMQAGQSRYVSQHEVAIPCPAPKPDRHPSQWRAPAAAASKAQHMPEPQPGRQVAREQPFTRPTQQSVQDEGSGYMSTESDSDTGTNDKAQVCCGTDTRSARADVTTRCKL